MNYVKDYRDGNAIAKFTDAIQESVSIFVVLFCMYDILIACVCAITCIQANFVLCFSEISNKNSYSSRPDFHISVKPFT